MSIVGAGGAIGGGCFTSYPIVFGVLARDQPTVFLELTVATIRSPCFKLYGSARNLVIGIRQYVFRKITGFSPSHKESST